MKYEWDKLKSESNLKKHGISFSDAVGVFEDDFALTLEDDSSEGEQRFVTLGLSSPGILVVVWTDRSFDVIRIISARRATAHEIKQYKEGFLS